MKGCIKIQYKNNSKRVAILMLILDKVVLKTGVLADKGVME